MATTLNGWPAIVSGSDAHLRSITIPGTKRVIKVQVDAAPLFAAFFADWQREMPARMKLDPGPTDGYNYRESRMTTGLSNHASGTAVDVLYSSVLPADGHPHMTTDEKDILDKILSRYVTVDNHRVLANGEWWSTPHCDGMHTELSQYWDRGCKRNTTLEDVKNVIKRLNIDNNGVRATGAWDGVVPLVSDVISAEKAGTATDATWRLASKLKDLGLFTGEPVRGQQKYPVNAVAAWHRANGTADPGTYDLATHQKIFATH
jgi:hypothetical protein